jgi:hypothetical protein
MSVPFMMKKLQASPAVSTEVRPPDMPPEEGDQDAGLQAAASDLIHAVHAGDQQAVAAALKAAFQMIEAAPQEEPQPEGQE